MSVIDRLNDWTEALDPDEAVPRFRRLFFALWMIYDIADLLFRGTATDFDPFAIAHARRTQLMLVQIALCACQALLAAGRTPLFALAAAALRAYEISIFPLNDFIYYTVVALLLAVSQPRRWQRDVLIWQTAWIYFTTALLKLNGDWLSGGHLFVRFGYLWEGLRWPHPAALEGCTRSLACLSQLAKSAAVAELALAALLLTGGRLGRSIAIALAVAIHLSAALLLNVWFFGASMIAQVAMLSRGRNNV